MKNFKNKKQKHFKKDTSSAPKSKKRANIWGTHAVLEALKNSDRDIYNLYITHDAKAGLDLPNESPLPEIVEKKELDKILPKGAVHQGIAINSSPLKEHFLKDLMIKCANQKNGKLLILDQITDPHNVGAIIRSACAFGASGIIMQKKHAPELTGSLAKSACGATEHVPVSYVTNLSRAINELQDDGFFVIGLDERGDEDINNFKPSQKTAIVLGAEGPGIRRLVKEQCDLLVKLPMAGPMPSINVSNAAAVSLYALLDQ